MKTIIAGTRHATFPNVVSAIKRYPYVNQITEVVSGKNKSTVWDEVSKKHLIFGADYWGEYWARNVAGIPVAEFPADWNTHGKAAGPIRNQQMAEYADALILVWDGESKGSADMLRKAKAKGLRIFVWNYKLGCEVSNGA